MQFYSGLVLLLLFFGSYWVFSAFKSYEYLHFYQISLLMLYAIGLALYLCEYIQYEHLNKVGALSSSLEFGMCFLKIVRNSSIVLLLLLLSYGYRITKPTLSRRNILTLNVLLLAFFVVQCFYVAMQQRTNWDSQKHYAAAVLTLVLVITLHHSFNHCNKMLEKLVALKEIYKLRIVMRLRKIALFTMSVFLIVALAEVQGECYFKANSACRYYKKRLDQADDGDSSLWRHQWLKDGAVDLIFALDLFFTMLTFCPSYHSLNFIYDPQRDLDLYNEKREREEELEMQNISTTGDALRLVG